jgi:hypothetical protein
MFNPLEFFRWGCMKYVVCFIPVTDHQNLRNGIAKAISTVKPDNLERTCIWFDFRLDMIRAARSVHAGTN